MTGMAYLNKLLNPFKRIYLLTYIPMLGLLLLLYATLFGLGPGARGFETSFGLVLVALIGLHLGQLPAYQGGQDGEDLPIIWLGLWWINILAAFAGFCALVLLSGGTILGIIATGGDLHYLLLLITPLPLIGSIISHA